VAGNINALVQGRSDLAHYKSWGIGIGVPIGPNGGAGQFPGEDGIAGPEIIAERKGSETGFDGLSQKRDPALTVGVVGPRGSGR
jgi:hypothetical protein